MGAATAEDANNYIAELARKKGAKLAVKSKSMASEETHLNVALEKAGTKALETDLGEWIIQLAGQKPSHMVMPAIHMLKEEVAELFSKVTGKEEPAEILHLVRLARQGPRAGGRGVQVLRPGHPGQEAGPLRDRHPPGHPLAPDHGNR